MVKPLSDKETQKAVVSALENLQGKETENRQIITDLIHIGMLRQIINETPGIDPNHLFTNEQLLTWLKIN